MEYTTPITNYKCLFTDILADKAFADVDGNFVYFATINGNEFSISVSRNANLEHSEYLSKNKHIFKGILFNNLWPYDNSKEIANEDDLRKIILEVNPPISPGDKKDYFFLYLFNHQRYEGERLNSKLYSHKDPSQLYFRTGAEMDYYFNCLINDGLIEKFGNAINEFAFQITYKGLTRAINLHDHGKNSKNCFIAMGFDSEFLWIRNSIKKICFDNGLNPILIDEVPLNFEQTINDGIIANLKKSKFCIADFTGQRNGVYFESGYALGKGMPILYLCHKEWFEKSHFDTNHFPHILYSNAQELETALANSIKARFL